MTGHVCRQLMAQMRRGKGCGSKGEAIDFRQDVNVLGGVVLTEAPVHVIVDDDILYVLHYSVEVVVCFVLADDNFICDEDVVERNLVRFMS